MDGFDRAQRARDLVPPTRHGAVRALAELLLLHLVVVVEPPHVRGDEEVPREPAVLDVGAGQILDREIDFDFDFDFDSFVRGGRGEAVCARVRRASLTLGLILGSCPPARGGFVSNSCCYTHGC